LSPAAEADLTEIAEYTETTWGPRQADRYRDALAAHFSAIGRGDVHSRKFSRRRAALRVSRCEHHFVFFALRPGARPLILAVLHENMDLMRRVRGRLEPDGEG
jgi:toxin ParE1/3/4